MQNDSSPPKARRVAWYLSGPVMAGAILVATALGVWMARRGEVSPLQPPSPAQNVPASTSKSTAALSTVVAPEAPSMSPEAQPVPESEQQLIFDWLTESETPAAAGEAMLTHWEELTPQGKVAVSRHLVNLVADDRFESLAGLMLDEENSVEVKEIIFADVLNRPDEVKWPLLLKVLEQETNPLSAEARRVLGFVLGADYKDDWAAWREHAQRELMKQIDSPEPAADAPLPPRSAKRE